MLQVSECSIECNFAGNGIFFMIGNGSSFINFSPARRGSGDVQKRTNQLRLPYVAVSDDRKVANGLRVIGFHKDNFLSESEIKVGLTLLSVLNGSVTCATTGGDPVFGGTGRNACPTKCSVRSKFIRAGRRKAS